MIKKNLKKRVKFLSILLLLLLLLISLSIYLFKPEYVGAQSDGGTKVWKAKLYTIVKWNQLPQFDEDGNKIINPKKDGYKIYWWPNQDAWMYL
jgi:hypothetical protein